MGGLHILWQHEDKEGDTAMLAMIPGYPDLSIGCTGPEFPDGVAVNLSREDAIRLRAALVEWLAD